MRSRSTWIISDRIIDIPPEKRSRQWADAMTDHFVINYHRIIPKDEWKALKFTELRKQLDELKDQYPALSHAPIIAEDPSIRRKSNVHMRGDWKRKGAEVLPGTPGVLHPFKSASATRLRPGGVARLSGESFNRPCNDQSLLAGVLRSRAGADIGRFRRSG